MNTEKKDRKYKKKDTKNIEKLSYSFSNMFNLKYGLDDQEYSVVQKNVFEDAEILLMIAFGRQ